MKRGNTRGSQRGGLKSAFDLYDFAVELTRLNLVRRSPRVSSSTIERQLADWLLRRPGAEDGDGIGVPGTWPRR